MVCWAGDFVGVTCRHMGKRLNMGACITPRRLRHGLHHGATHTSTDDNSGKLHLQVPCSVFRRLQQRLLFLSSHLLLLNLEKGPPESQKSGELPESCEFLSRPRREVVNPKETLMMSPILIALLWCNLSTTPRTEALYFFTPWTWVHHLMLWPIKYGRTFYDLTVSIVYLLGASCHGGMHLPWDHKTERCSGHLEKLWGTNWHTGKSNKYRGARELIRIHCRGGLRMHNVNQNEPDSRSWPESLTHKLVSKIKALIKPVSL